MAEIVKSYDMRYRIAALNANYAMDSYSRDVREILDNLGETCLQADDAVSTFNFYSLLDELRKINGIERYSEKL